MITNFLRGGNGGQQVCLALWICANLSIAIQWNWRVFWRFDSDFSKRKLLIFGIVFVNYSCLEGDWLGDGLLLWAIAWLPGMYLLQHGRWK